MSPAAEGRNAQGRADLTAGEGFVLGGWGRLLTTCLLFPLIKIRLMVAAGYVPGLDVQGAFAMVVARHGVLGLYAGVVPELFRGSLYQCFITGTKEWLLRSNLRAMRSCCGCAPKWD